MKKKDKIKAEKDDFDKFDKEKSQSGENIIFNKDNDIDINDSNIDINDINDINDNEEKKNN